MAWWAWTTPGVLLGVGAVGFLYGWVMWGPWKDSRAPGEMPTRRQALWFYIALLAAYAALGSPIGVYAMSVSFTFHMFQHMIAGLAVPPFLIRGIPPWAWRRLLRPRAVAALFGRLVRPVPAILLFNVVFGLMVYPPIITEMVRSMPAMVDWHVGLMVVGIFMWWPIMSPLSEFPPLHPGLQILYLFVDGIPMILPLALVTINTTPIYTAAYAGRHLLFGLTLVEDQQLGGALCLTIVHFVYGGMVFPRFRDWLRRERALDATVEVPVLRMPRRVPEVVWADGAGLRTPGQVVEWPLPSSPDD